MIRGSGSCHLNNNNTGCVADNRFPSLDGIHWRWNWAHASSTVYCINIVRGVSFHQTILPFWWKLRNNHSILQLYPNFLKAYSWFNVLQKDKKLKFIQRKFPTTILFVNHIGATRDTRSTSYAVGKLSHFHHFLTLLKNQVLPAHIHVCPQYDHNSSLKDKTPSDCHWAYTRTHTPRLMLYGSSRCRIELWAISLHTFIHHFITSHAHFVNAHFMECNKRQQKILFGSFFIFWLLFCNYICARCMPSVSANKRTIFLSVFRAHVHSKCVCACLLFN